MSRYVVVAPVIALGMLLGRAVCALGLGIDDARRMLALVLVSVALGASCVAVSYLTRREW